MKQRYTDELGEWIKKRKEKTRDKNLVAFLAVKADIQEALNEGYSVKIIWEHMFENKRIEYGYETFLNYTNRMINKKNGFNARGGKIVGNQPNVKDVKSENKENEKTPAKTNDKFEIPGFNYNPIMKKEDLF